MIDSIEKARSAKHSPNCFGKSFAFLDSAQAHAGEVNLWNGFKSPLLLKSSQDLLFDCSLACMDDDMFRFRVWQ